MMPPPDIRPAYKPSHLSRQVGVFDLTTFGRIIWPIVQKQVEHKEDAQWQQDNLANPHVVADKAVRVKKMFAAIAGSYDLNNRLHSMGRDQAWRKKAAALCHVKATDVVLDVACGTGDLSLVFSQLGPRHVIGVDFTHEMVAIATQKQSRPQMKGKTRSTPTRVTFADGDAMRLPLADRSVDVVSIAFGIRNVADPAAAVREFYRVLRPGGRLCILEFSLPTSKLLQAGYMFYFKRIMPHTATLISRDRSGAYKYLPQSVNTFLGRRQTLDMMTEAGFVSGNLYPLTFGIAVAYMARKR